MNQEVKEISVRELDFIKSNNMAKIIGMYGSLVDRLIEGDAAASIREYAAIRKKVGEFIWEHRYVDLDPWTDFDDQGNYTGTKSLERPPIKF